jgi:2-C-methyl-D-erythritol 4-phosphate cytidylyltransferase
MGGIDKQIRTIAGVPVLARTVAAFEQCPEVGAIVLVLNPDNMAAAVEMGNAFGWKKVQSMIAGGERRQDSVRVGLNAVNDLTRRGFSFTYVAIHDGARPLLTPGLISRGLEAAQEVGAAIAALPATETIKTVDATGTITGTPARSNLWIAQTPQVFRIDLLVGAYQALEQSGGETEATDCARLLELAGRPVKVYQGERTNIKITQSEDLAIAEALARMMQGHVS